MMIPIQVSTPEKGLNTSNPVKLEYDINYEIKNNLDNLEETESRILLPELLIFRNIFIKNQITILIKDYDYHSAYNFLDNIEVNFNELTLKLINHMKNRISIKTQEAKEIIPRYKDKDLFPVKDIIALQITEYYLVLKAKQKSGDLAEFVLMLNPFNIKLAEIFIEEKLKIRIGEFIKTYNYVRKKVKRYLIKEKDTELLKFLDEHFDNGFRDSSDISIKFLNILIEYKLNQIEEISSDLKRFYDFSEKLEKLNKNIRDKVAHNLTGINESDIKNAINMSSSKIIKEIIKSINYVFGNKIKKEIYDIYDNINSYIINEMNESI